MRLLIENCKLFNGDVRSVYVDGSAIRTASASGSQEVPRDVRRIDANGGTLLTGLVDTHCHPFEYGWLKRNVDLRGTSSVTGLRLRLAAGVRKSSPGRWVAGRGWDQEAFSDRKMPSRGDIDDVSPNNPVVLGRVDGHVALLNTRAIEALALEGREGLEYERDSRGSLTGIVKEGALPGVFAALPRSQEQSSSDLLGAEFEAVRFGLTKLHCIVSEEGFQEELAALTSLHRSDSLSMRYRVYIPPGAVGYAREKGLAEQLGDDKVRINGVKIYADGSLGSRTAALREPYADDPGNSGVLRYTDEELSRLVEDADQAGYQAIVHAIGDRAIEQAMAAISRVSGSRNPRGHRIEHASLLPRDLRSRMAKDRIGASVQPCFVTSDTWAVDRLGEERARDLYPFRSMLDEGIRTSGGSDSPVESMSPVIGAWAAMVRGGVAPDEALSLPWALSLYTTHAGPNGLDGPPVIGEGAPADLTLLDSNIEGMHPALFRKVGVTAVVVGGALAYSAEG